MALPEYEVFAVRYAWRQVKRSDNFLGGDPHDAPMPMDYYVWVARHSSRTFVVDTGFSQSVGSARKRTFLRWPREGLAMIDVKAAEVKDVIITHMHYDHAGTLSDFPSARFHIQDEEMAYATGRYMCNHQFSHGLEVEDVVAMVRNVFDDRVTFHEGAADLAPGISVHHIGGHTKGLQCVRVHTRRGWMVLASDCAHYYEHIETNRFFRAVYNVGDMLDGYQTIRGLAESPRHIIPGHDPLVMKKYPAAAPSLEGIVARLDVDPIA